MQPRPSRTGVLLVNLGTPDAPTSGAVRRYLREFLSDPRVLDMPALGRWLLLNAIILPTRPRKSAAAYRKIWQPDGSPLLIHGRALADGVGRALGPDFVVELAMRYGSPAIAPALERLQAAEVDRLVIVPLYPQYSAAATASTLARVMECAAGGWDAPAIVSVRDFYADRAWSDAQAAVAGRPLREFAPDHVLFSYHGLPERQMQRSDVKGGRCLASAGCCADPAAAARGCYRAQCFATTDLLTKALGLDAEHCSSAFQSRLGRTPWIQPFTDERLPALAAAGVRRLAVLCPAFVADCLETVEEIGIRARAQWAELGGEALLLCPCPNSDPVWIDGLADLVRRQVPTAG